MSTSSSYKEPSEVLKRLFLPPKDPSLTLSQDYQWLVITQEPPLPSIELLAKPEEKLAGIRFDPALFSPSRLDWAESLVLQHMATGKKQTMDLPTNSEGIRYIRFHPTKSYFVFTSKVKNELSLELYKCELIDGQWITTQITLNGQRMNFVFGCAYQFTSNGNNLLVKVIPNNWPTSPPEEPVSTGPSIQQVQKDARKAPGRTYQDLLKNEYDEAKLKHFLTTEVLSVDTMSLDVKLVQQTRGGCLIQSMESSPCGQFLLVQLTTKFSYSVPIRRFGKDVQLWQLNSEKIVEVASLPVDDEIPLAYDACTRHPRSFHFHPCMDHTIIYALATDGGLSLADKFDGDERDALYTRTLDENTLILADHVKLVGLGWRYAGLDFTESGLGLLEEYRWNDRMERKYILGTEGAKRLLWERSWEDRYTAPGEPMTRRGAMGNILLFNLHHHPFI